jgi:predicted transcriptional regulator
MKSLSKLRRAAGLTQHALGVRAKVPRSKIANVETDRATFTDDERRRVLTVLTGYAKQNIADFNASIALVDGGANEV